MRRRVRKACANTSPAWWARPVDAAVRRRPARGASTEADLPAQEAQACPHPRVPCAHEHARRPPRAEAPPRQGPQAAHRLSRGPARRGRPSAGRLSRSAEFERVYRQGRSKATASSCSTRSRARTAGARARGSGCPCRARSAAPSSARASSAAARGLLGGGRAAARRAGLRRRRAPGRARAGRARGHGRHPHARWPSWSASWRRPGAGVMSAPVAAGADPRSTSASSRRRCRRAASTTRRARPTRCRRSSATAYCAARRSRSGALCAATRGATAASTPSWLRRLFRAPTAPSHSQLFVLANLLQPLIDLFEAVLVFFHDTSAELGHGDRRADLVVRVLLLPLTLKQFKSMQSWPRTSRR